MKSAILIAAICIGGAFPSIAVAAEPAPAASHPVDMVWIPAGTFQMGTPATYEGAHDPDEEPLRPVQLTKGFWLARNETTNADYAKFLAALEAAGGDDSKWRHAEQPAGADGKAKDHTPQSWKAKNLNAPKQPVVGVDWWDAYAYAKWAGLRLPTEAEWEYAARGKDARLLVWGSEWPPKSKLGNFADESLKKIEPGAEVVKGYDDGHAASAPVGSFPAGASWCGALDLTGNVWEWCNDRYAPYVAAENKDPVGSSTEPGRVVRGGSWRGADIADFRCAFRDNYDPETRQDDLGFRVARDFNPAHDPAPGATKPDASPAATP